MVSVCVCVCGKDTDTSKTPQLPPIFNSSYPSVPSHFPPTAPHLSHILDSSFLSLPLLPGASHLGIAGWWGAWPSSMSGIRPPSSACGLGGANADTDVGSKPRAVTATCVAGMFYPSTQVKLYLTSQVNYEQIPIRDDNLARVKTESGTGNWGRINFFFFVWNFAFTSGSEGQILTREVTKVMF